MTPNKQVRVTFQTPAFRLSYPNLFEPAAVMGDEKNKKYSITMLFPKQALVTTLKASKHPASTWMAADNCQGFYQEIVKVARANFGPEVDLKSLKLTKFRDGDKPKESGKIDENEKGYIVVRTTSSEKNRPDCLRQDKTRITAENSGELYPGCWVRAVLTIAPFLTPQHGVTIYLAGVQKLADDATFSSRPRVEDEFDAVVAEGQAAPGSGVVGSPETKNPWEI